MVVAITYIHYLHFGSQLLAPSLAVSEFCFCPHTLCHPCVNIMLSIDMPEAHIVYILPRYILYILYGDWTTIENYVLQRGFLYGISTCE